MIFRPEITDPVFTRIKNKPDGWFVRSSNAGETSNLVYFTPHSTELNASTRMVYSDFHHCESK
jgi:hypothetical protein